MVDEKVSEMGAISPANIAAEFPVIQPGNTTDNFRLNIAQSLGFTGRIYLASNVGPGDPSIGVQSLISGASPDSGWVVIDPYTVECELRKVTGISGNQLTVAALTYSHSAFDSIFWTDSDLASVMWFGAKMNGVADDTIAFQRALATSLNVSIPEGTAILSGTLSPQSNGSFFGMGVGKTILDFSGLADIAINAPADYGQLKDFSLHGDSTPGSFGINIEAGNRPQSTFWNGAIRIIGFEYGFYLDNNAGGVLSCYFGDLYIHTCTTGLYLGPIVPGWANAISFGHVVAHTCTTGIHVNGANSISFKFLHGENCTTGLNVQNGHSIFSGGGWWEGNVTHFDIANYPDAGRIVIFGSADAAGAIIYVNSPSRSDLFPRSVNLNYFYGRWFHEQIGFHDTHLVFGQQVEGISALNITLTAGATPDTTG